MSKLKRPHPDFKRGMGDDHEEYLFHCFGCKHDHRYIVKWGTKHKTECEARFKQDPAKYPLGNFPQWTFNNNMMNPTFQPSLLYNYKRWPTDEEHTRIMAGEKVDIPNTVCHLYVTDGKIQYLGDCTHEFKGKTIEMKDVDE